MSEAEHIAPDNALFLVALDAGDPEKQAAEQHARTCERCRQLLRESQQILGLLDRELIEPMPLPAGLEQRVQAAVFAARPARARLRWEYLVWLLGALFSIGLSLHDGHASPHLHAGLGLRCLGYELGFGAVAFVAGWFSVRKIDGLFDPTRASIFALGGALVGQNLLRTRCETADITHLFMFHVSGVLLATLLSAGAARWLTRA